jgi:hypothetical protein
MSGLIVHMPKCAGSSVRALLDHHFPTRVDFSYQSFFRIPFAERAGVISDALENPAELPHDRIVYGHVFPVKHLGRNLNSNVKLATILRDPLDRIRSHYVYWNAGEFDHYLWDKMKAENWGFSDFAFSPEMRNFYAQHSVHVPIERYDYVGLYENLASSVRGCCAAVGLRLPQDAVVPHTNANVEQRKDLISTIDIEAFKKWHSIDYSFYEFARERFHST